MEGHQLNDLERDGHRKGIWYVVGSVPLLTEVLMLVLDRLHRCSLAFILLLDILIVAAAFACAELLVPREMDMTVRTRHCVDFVPGLLGPDEGNDTWFQSWKVESDDYVCTTVEPYAEESANRNFFRSLFIGGKLHESFQMPVRHNRTLVHFNRGQRFLKGYLTVVLPMPEEDKPAENASIRLRLGARNSGGKQARWEQLGRAEHALNLNDCQSRIIELDDNSTTEQCVLNQRLFETPSVDRQFYLLNARVRHMTSPPISMGLVLVHQSRLYTLVCLNIHACCLGLVTLALLVFCWRCCRVYRSVPVGHRLLAVLAVALIIWDIPVGYAALDVDMPWLGLVDCIRMDLFYLAFLSVSFIFVCERAFIRGVRRRLGVYLCSQLPLVCGVLLLLALDIFIQLSQLWDVFWLRPDWTRFCFAALLIANALYVVLMCAAAAARVCRCGRTGGKPLPVRYRLAVVLTCLTAAAACVEHAERREADNSWFWSWTETRPTGGHLLYIGMLVWYNVFVLTLLILYIPTRPMVELSDPFYEDEQKVPLNGSTDVPEPITRGGAVDDEREDLDGGDRQPMVATREP